MIITRYEAPQKLPNRSFAPLSYWASLYRTYQHFSLCLDIETEGINKPITVVGLYQPKPGIPEVTQLIQGSTLTPGNLHDSLGRPELIITFNGLNMDIPRIRQEFPHVIPENIKILDLYRIAKRLNLNCSLTTLEQTFNIDRLDDYSKRKHIAVKLWKQHLQGHPWALQRLLEYNKQDTINLYPLAEQLCQIIKNNQESNGPYPATERSGIAEQ